MAGERAVQGVSPDMLMEAMDAVTDGVVIVDTDSRIVYLNEAYTHILNVKKEKVLGILKFILKDNNKAIDFLTNDNRIVTWVKNGHYSPENCYRNGMIEGIPFNIDASDFLGVFGEEQ